jgi:hypothetical protein
MHKNISYHLLNKSKFKSKTKTNRNITSIITKTVTIFQTSIFTIIESKDKRKKILKLDLIVYYLIVYKEKVRF